MLTLIAFMLIQVLSYVSGPLQAHINVTLSLANSMRSRPVLPLRKDIFVTCTAFVHVSAERERQSCAIEVVMQGFIPAKGFIS